MKCDNCRHRESDAVCYCVDCGKRLCHKHEKVGATVLVVPVLFPPSQPFSRVRMRHVKTGSKGVGYSPGMRRFSQFQSFTHFWHLGKLHVVNSILSKMSFFCSATPLQLGVLCACAKFMQAVRMKLSTDDFFFVNACSYNDGCPPKQIYAIVVLSFQLNFPITTVNFLMLNNCNCGIISQL